MHLKTAGSCKKDRIQENLRYVKNVRDNPSRQLVQIVFRMQDLRPRSIDMGRQPKIDRNHQANIALQGLRGWG
jgi:hypothetical protein